MSMVPLQRITFRVTVATEEASPSGKSGKFHREFPAKPRKRLQVGATNLTKAASTPALPPRLGSHGPGWMRQGEDPAAVAPFLSETNIELMRASLTAGDAWSGTSAAPSGSQEASLVVQSAQRRRQTELAPVQGSLGGKHYHLESIPAASEAPPPASRDEAPAHQETAVTSEENASLELARGKLHDAFLDKYGSMRAVFRAFDSDANGMISAQRFYDMVEAAEVDLSAAQVRELYRRADANGDNTMAFHEFLQLFAHEGESAYSPLRQPRDLVADPSSSLTLKYRTPLELSPRSRRRMKQLRVQVTDELTRQHGEALSVHGGKHDLLLAYAFKNLDSDNDGFLSYDQVERALGSDYLQLGIPASDMSDMLRLMDRNSDHEISMREFVHYFAAGEKEPPTDLIDNARKKELAALHAKMTAPLTPREAFDPRPAPVETVDANPPSDLPLASGCMQEQLLRRTVASLALQDAPERRQALPRRLASSVSVPTLRPSTTPCDGAASLQPAQSKAGASADATRAGRRSLASLTLGSEAPDDGRASLSSAPASQDRYWRRRLERTGWSRVGVGGDGARADSALFQPAAERFSTSSSAAHSPITRALPASLAAECGPVSVAVGQGGVLLVREGFSSAAAEHESRERRRNARAERTEVLVRGMEAERAREERLRDWRARARVRRAAGEKFAYLDAQQEAEARVAAREMHMRKRHGGAAFLRMWAGSADSQFNATS